MNPIIDHKIDRDQLHGQLHPCFSCNKPTNAVPVTYIDRKIIVCSAACFKLYAFGHKKPKVMKKYVNESKL